LKKRLVHEMKGDAKGFSTIFSMMTRRAFITFINYFILGLIGLVSWYFIANNISKEYVGIVYFAIGFGGFFSMITDLGFRSAHVKRISEGRDLGECIGTYLSVQIVLIIVFVSSVIFTIWAWENLLGYGFESNNHKIMIYLIMGFFISTQLANIGSLTLSAKLETAKQQLLPLGGAIVQMIMTLVVVIFFPKNLILFGSTWVIGAATNMLISFFFLAQFPIKRPSWGLFKDYFWFAIPICIGTALGTIPINVDRILIQLFWNAENVAIYSGGQRFSVYLIQIPAAFALIIFPVISSLNSKGNTGALKEIVLSTERLLSMIMAPICALAFILAIPIVTILGDEQYLDSYMILQALAVWAFIRALSIPYVNFTIGIGKPKINAVISVIIVSMIVILDLIFIPKSLFGIPMFGFGPFGAALATLLSAVISTLLFRGIIYKNYKLFVNPKIIQSIIAALVMSVILYLLILIFPVTRVYLLILYVINGLMIYFITLYLLKGFTPQDKKLLIETMDPMKMLRYIKNEITNKGGETPKEK